ncbi:LysR family transcriptional regulator [Acidovorax sp. NCPPB 3576]|uniref:LysR family transcriptional regulator n=1 Tax=Acidovorax sp. NCPPB 3576 TaxID=2940488 RepID=UPI00234A349B|nr:LysR family transcriptional regulator [Acidovorax sp. NCPPB 3576]WCM89140.1 LysR family transcriptional regulator [Acidovorax sp. NCPPB 3576]
MNLRQLEVFQAVMQTGNMSAAARLINITPSAVSKTIAHAELQLGYALFSRARGALLPTPEAQALFTASSQIHSQLDELRRTAHNLRQPEGGLVRLAAIPSVTHEFLPAVLERHAQQSPRVRVEVRTLHQDQMAQALLTRSVDFALGFYDHPHPQLESSILVSGPLFIAVARDIWLRAVRLNRSDPITFLANTPMIQLLGDEPMRQPMAELAQTLGVHTELGIQMQTSQLALALVKRGMGWTVIDFLTARNLDPTAITAVPLRDLPPMALHAYHAANRPPDRHAARMLALLSNVLMQTMARTPSEAATL